MNDSKQKQAGDQHIRSLLLAILNKNVSASVREELADLTEAEWQDVVTVAGQLKIAPVIGQSLLDDPEYQVLPDLVIEKLRQSSEENLARNSEITKRLDDVLTLAREHEIPVMVLKGWHLANAYYSSPASRFMWDVDLLVSQSDFARFVNLLSALGYLPCKDASVDEIAAGYDKSIDLQIDDDFRFEMEVHWQVELPQDERRFDYRDLWGRARILAALKEDVQCMSMEHLLFHICIHCSLHDEFLCAIQPFVDIREILRHDSNTIDWPLFFEIVRFGRARKSVCLTLLAASDLLEITLPDHVLEELRTESVPDEVFEFAQRVSMRNVDSRQGWKQPNLLRLMGSNGIAGRMVALKVGLFPPKTRIARRYRVNPESLQIYWYYLVRLKDLIIDDRQNAADLLKSDPEIHKLAKDMLNLKHEQQVIARWIKED